MYVIIVRRVLNVIFSFFSICEKKSKISLLILIIFVFIKGFYKEKDRIVFVVVFESFR